MDRIHAVNPPVITRKRGRLSVPVGLDDHVSRIEAARLLGYPSSFRVRQLEKQGKLKAVRGPMSSAWYARSDVLALRASERAPGFPSGEHPFVATSPARRRSDPELIAYLRGFASAEAGADGAPSVADLVADMGISIARAQKVHRFWLTHDGHPAANEARARRASAGRSRLSGEAVKATPTETAPAERRSAARLSRATLIRQLRSPDPTLRAEAYEGLRAKPRPGEG